MTLIFILQKKHKVIFDSTKERMKRLATELVSDADSRSPALWIKMSLEKETLRAL